MASEMNRLTVELVEEFQHLLPDAGRIAGIVAGLQEATLPGIMEYGCLRWAHDWCFPPLPPAVANSVLGLALDEVRSALGTRVTGPPKRALRRADVQSAEFHVIESEADLISPDWKQFVLRYERSTRCAGFGAGVATLLHVALSEMADNAILHSDSPVSALVGYRVTDGVSQFCVAGGTGS